MRRDRDELAFHHYLSNPAVPVPEKLLVVILPQCAGKAASLSQIVNCMSKEVRTLQRRPEKRHFDTVDLGRVDKRCHSAISLKSWWQGRAVQISGAAGSELSGT
jgi:hypothetical protein